MAGDITYADVAMLPRERRDVPSRTPVPGTTSNQLLDIHCFLSCALSLFHFKNCYWIILEECYKMLHAKVMGRAKICNGRSDPHETQIRKANLQLVLLQSSVTVLAPCFK